jgi:FKBP-type peptidyl-prolyl cis-trans isomerase 2
MIKKGHFIEISYTGIIKDGNLVFDTTDEKVAKENNIFNSKAEYGPIIICVGQGQLIKGLDADLIGKDLNKEYKVEVAPENAFGKKNAQLLKLVPTNIFIKQNIMPQPGLQVNIDNNVGVIKTVTGGRTIVDFNHPLSGKDVIYKYKVTKIINDTVEKIKSVLSVILNISKKNIDVKYAAGKAEISMIKLPEFIQTEMIKKIKELIPEIKELKFTEAKKEENAQKANPSGTPEAKVSERKETKADGKKPEKAK